MTLLRLSPVLTAELEQNNATCVRNNGDCPYFDTLTSLESVKLGTHATWPPSTINDPRIPPSCPVIRIARTKVSFLLSGSNSQLAWLLQLLPELEDFAAQLIDLTLHLPHRVDHRVGQLMAEAVQPFSVLPNHFARDADYGAAGRHFLQDNRIRSDIRLVPDFKRTKHLCPRPDYDIVADGRCRLPFSLPLPPNVTP